ncbi:MAG: 50S ribosomal protein L10 [Candidatus Aenigmatarchaeota archaeon]
MIREWKKKDVEEMKELLNENPVVGVTSMYKIPAPQLQDIRKDLHGKAKIRMSRKTLMKRALEESDREDIEDLKEHLKGESAFIFTEMNPFKLYSYLQENKSSAPAKAGDIAPNDIVVNEGGTGIDPGPAIGKLQNAGLKTSIDEGEIKIVQESVVAEQGDEISHEEAEALKMLDMEPMEIGLSIKAVWEGGNVFMPKDLDIDIEEHKEKMKAAYQRAMNLSVNAGYVTEENIEILLSKAWRKAKALALESEYPTEENIGEMLRMTQSKTKSLKSKVEEVS